jgi:hypothetical protein
LLRLVQIARKAAQAGQIELHKRPLPKGPPEEGFAVRPMW